MVIVAQIIYAESTAGNTKPGLAGQLLNETMCGLAFVPEVAG